MSLELVLCLLVLVLSLQEKTEPVLEETEPV